MSDENVTKPPALLFKRTWAILAAFGLLTAVGTALFNLVVDKGGDLLVRPLRAKVTTEAPTAYWFPDTVAVPTARRDWWRREAGRGPSVWGRWAEGAGGVPYGAASLRLTLRGRDDVPVILGTPTLRVVAHQPIKGGWANTGPGGCGGQFTPLQFRADLAQPPTELYVWPDSDAGERMVNLWVDYRSFETLSVTVTAAAGIVHWVIDVPYTYEERDGTLTVRSESGEAFVLAGGGNPRAVRDAGYRRDDSFVWKLRDRRLGKRDTNPANYLCF